MVAAMVAILPRRRNRLIPIADNRAATVSRVGMVSQIVDMDNQTTDSRVGNSMDNQVGNSMDNSKLAINISNPMELRELQVRQVPQAQPLWACIQMLQLV